MYDRFMNHWKAFDAAELGAALRQVRQSKGWDQEQLATRLGVTRMTVSRLERGLPVSIDTAMRALSECGYAVVVAPKFSTVRIGDEA